MYGSAITYKREQAERKRKRRLFTEAQEIQMQNQIEAQVNEIIRGLRFKIEDVRNIINGHIQAEKWK